MDKELSALLKGINDEDLKTTFGTAATVVIEKQADAEEKFRKYLEYDVPVRIGDIIEYKGKNYCVTCVYTDNSVDICGEDADKENIGLYKKDVKVIGKMQVILEG